MFRGYLIVAVLFFLSNVQRIESLQCYQCGCFVIPGETTCQEESELNCVIQYVENKYCYILRTAGDIEFGHNSNSDLVFLESLHYIRATEEFAYSETTSTWQTPKVTQVSYGCDWNLCNSPKILGLLPTGLSFDVSTKLLTDLFVPGPTESLTSCLSCSQFINSISDVNCSSTPCTGSCLIDDHIDDPQYNDGTYSIVYESVCTGNQPTPTTVHIKGNYYLDDRISDITEIDVYCRKNNCNSIINAKAVQQNATVTTELNNQLFFRPTTIATTPSTPNSQLIECYVCRCTQETGATNCLVPQCTTEFRNASYCEIVRDRSESPDLEIVTLGHIPKSAVQYPHYIYAVENLELYTNLTWNPPSVSFITYVCDWTLCNDPRIVDKLVSNFQFNAYPTEIAQYIQGTQPLSSCLQCQLCTNNTADFSKCVSVGCPANGYCFIEQYIDDPQYNDCEYAFVADCEPDSPGSSMIIGATYSIDDDILDVDQFDLYCSLNDCNNVATVNALKNLLLKDIRLDPLFFIRPVVNTTTTATTTTENPGPPSAAAKNYFLSLFYLLLPLTLWFSNRL